MFWWKSGNGDGVISARKHIDCEDDSYIECDNYCGYNEDDDKKCLDDLYELVKHEGEGSEDFFTLANNHHPAGFHGQGGPGGGHPFGGGKPTTGKFSEFEFKNNATANSFSASLMKMLVLQIFIFCLIF